jgi:hypothetical protein
MAVHNVSSREIGAHGIVLTANTEEIVQFADDVGTVEILNMTGTAAVYFSFDGNPAVVGGARCLVLPAAISSAEYAPRGTDPTAVSLISAGTPTVSVSRAVLDDRTQ